MKYTSHSTASTRSLPVFRSPVDWVSSSLGLPLFSDLKLLLLELLFMLARLGVQFAQLAEVIVGLGDGILDAGQGLAAQGGGVRVAARIEHAAHGAELAGDVAVAAQDRSQISIAAPIELFKARDEALGISGAGRAFLVLIPQFGVVRFHGGETLSRG